jgi:hypothetical protein
LAYQAVDSLARIAGGKHHVNPTVLLFGAAIVLPVVVTVIMGALEEGVDKIGWRGRLVKTGWDLCILSVGSAGIYATPQMVDGWGPAAPLFAAGSVVISLGFTVAISFIRKIDPARITLLHGLGSIALGGGALGMPIYFVLHST